MEPSDQSQQRTSKLSTDLNSTGSNTPEAWFIRVFRISLVTLPYGFFVNLIAILGMVLVARHHLKRLGQSYVDPLTRWALITISLGMVVSAIAAIDRGEAALQLANFLPFFWLFTLLPFMVRSPFTQYTMARYWVLASMPIHGVAIAEYLAKTDRLPLFFHNWGVVQAWRSAPHIGRAMVMFDHPNVFANYAILTFGLALGLMLWPSATGESPTTKKTYSMGIGMAAGLNLVGLFCSGSRNGILVAGTQFILLVLIVKLNRTLLWIGSFSLAALSLSIFKFGLGTRSIGILQVMDDPRVGVWKIALDLIGERPWLGWGPGSFKFLYPSRLIDPTYQEVFHTHNLWLLLSAEYGLPVMIGLTVIVGFICYKAARRLLTIDSLTPSRRMLTISYGLSLWGSIQFSMIDVTFYDARLNVMTWVLLSVLYAQSLKESSAHNQDLSA